MVVSCKADETADLLCALQVLYQRYSSPCYVCCSHTSRVLSFLPVQGTSHIWELENNRDLLYLASSMSEGVAKEGVRLLCSLHA